MPNIEPAQKDPIPNAGSEWYKPADPQKLRQLLSSPAALTRMGEVAKQLTPERLLNISLSVINAPTKARPGFTLLDCTPMSLLQSVIDLASIGLEPGGVSQFAYLIPYQDRKSGRVLARAQVGYQGFVELAYRHGGLRTIETFIVHEKDHLELVFGFNPIFEFAPVLRGIRGEPYAVICDAQFEDDRRVVYPMSKEEVYLIRDRSESYQGAVKYNSKGSPWITDELAMWRKTVIKQAQKLWRKSKEQEDALDIDNRDDGNIIEGVVTSRPFEVVKPGEASNKESEALPPAQERQTIEVEERERVPVKTEARQQEEPRPSEAEPADPSYSNIMDPITELQLRIERVDNRDAFDAAQIEANENRGSMSEAEWASIRDALRKKKAELK